MYLEDTGTYHAYCSRWERYPDIGRPLVIVLQRPAVPELVGFGYIAFQT